MKNEKEEKRFSAAFYSLTTSAMELIKIFGINSPVDVLKKYVDHWRNKNKSFDRPIVKSS